SWSRRGRPAHRRRRRGRAGAGAAAARRDEASPPPWAGRRSRRGGLRWRALPWRSWSIVSFRAGHRIALLPEVAEKGFAALAPPLEGPGNVAGARGRDDTCEDQARPLDRDDGEVVGRGIDVEHGHVG